MRILIGEDDRKLAAQLKKGLDESGHACSLAFQGPDGFESAQSREFHVVVLDVMLPMLDGISIARWIFEIHAGTISVQSEPGKGSVFEIRLPIGKH